MAPAVLGQANRYFPMLSITLYFGPPPPGLPRRGDNNSCLKIFLLLAIVHSERLILSIMDTSPPPECQADSRPRKNLPRATWPPSPATSGPVLRIDRHIDRSLLSRRRPYEMQQAGCDDGRPFRCLCRDHSNRPQCPFRRNPNERCLQVVAGNF